MLITNTSFVTDNSTEPPTITYSNPVTTVVKKPQPIIIRCNNFWDPCKHCRPCCDNWPAPCNLLENSCHCNFLACKNFGNCLCDRQHSNHCNNKISNCCFNDQFHCNNSNKKRCCFRICFPFFC